MNEINTDVTSFEKITKDMLNLYKRKNHDYGNSVSKTYQEYGMTSFLVRMQDKLNRLRTLSSGHTTLVEDEKIRDTLLDLANYSILAIIEYDKDMNKILIDKGEEKNV